MFYHFDNKTDGHDKTNDIPLPLKHIKWSINTIALEKKHFFISILDIILRKITVK